jgi:hypothetical protein
MRKKATWLLCGAVALAIGAQALPGTADAEDTPPAPQITITEHTVHGINGYHGGQKAEMDALAGGEQPPSRPEDPWNGFTLKERRNEAAAYVIPDKYGFLDYHTFYDPGYRPGSIVKVTVEGTYTAVDVTAPAGTSPGALADAVRAKEKVPAGAPLLDTLGEHKKFVRIHETFTQFMSEHHHTDTTMYLPWTLAKWSTVERKNAFNYSDSLKFNDKPLPDYLVPAIDELQDKCEGVSSAICKLTPAQWADIMARSDQVVDTAKDFAEYRKAPKATNTHALTNAQAGKALAAADDAVNDAVKKLAKGKPAVKTPDFVPTSLKGWTVSLSATALRTYTTFGDSNATALDKAEALLAAVPLVGETVGFANALVKADPEAMAINIISLATLGAMSACPPAAMLGGAILVGHAIVKGLISFFSSQPVQSKPVDVQLEQAKNGAVAAWTPKVPKDVAPGKSDPKSVLPQLANSFDVSAKTGYVFTFYRAEVYPKDVDKVGIVKSARARVWQDGLPLYNITCTKTAPFLGVYPTYGFLCKAPKPTVVEVKRPIRVQVIYTVGKRTAGQKQKSMEYHLVPQFDGTSGELYSLETLGTFTIKN